MEIVFLTKAVNSVLATGIVPVYPKRLKKFLLGFSTYHKILSLKFLAEIYYMWYLRTLGLFLP